MKDYDLILGMLKDIERMLERDVSGDDYVRSAKQYVGTAIMLLAAAKRREDSAGGKQNE